MNEINILYIFCQWENYKIFLWQRIYGQQRFFVKPIRAMPR